MDKKPKKFLTIAQVLEFQGKATNAGLYKGKVREKWSRESWVPNDEEKLADLLKKYSPAALRKKAWRMVNKNSEVDATNKNDNNKLND